jgi:hypothetical protein
MDTDLQTFLDQAADITAPIARRLRSKRNTIQDLDDLSDALKDIARTIDIVRTKQHLRNKKVDSQE